MNVRFYHDFKIGDRVRCMRRHHNDYFVEPRVGDICEITKLNGERDVFVRGYPGSFDADRFVKFEQLFFTSAAIRS